MDTIDDGNESQSSIITCTAYGTNAGEDTVIVKGEKAMVFCTMIVDVAICIQNDRRWLMKLLCYDKKMTLFMSVCGSNDEDLVHFMNGIVFENHVLSRKDVDTLLLMREDKDRTALFHAFSADNNDICDLIIEKLGTTHHKDALPQCLLSYDYDVIQMRII